MGMFGGKTDRAKDVAKFDKALLTVFLYLQLFGLPFVMNFDYSVDGILFFSIQYHPFYPQSSHFPHTDPLYSSVFTSNCL